MTKGDIRHGTTTAYAHYKCRCEECRAAVAEYNRKRQKAKRDGTWVPGRAVIQKHSCIGPECDLVARYKTPARLCRGHYLQVWNGKPLTPLSKKRRAKDGQKQCSRCELVLPLDAFNKQNAKRIQSACKRCASIAARAQRYGLTFDAVKAMLDSPCAGCGSEVLGKGAHIDHDHESGMVRGVLCHNCNTVLTKHMTPTILRRLANYLEASC